MRLKVFDMFGGIGGFSLGLHKAGYETVAYSEINKYASSIYAKHNPGIRNFGDVRELDPSSLPDFDVLAAGFPCQPFSIAGKRGGIKDERGTLFDEILRIAEQKRPKFLLLENVKGLMSIERGRVFGSMLAALDEIRYDAQWQIINSKYFVPQNRERIFIIASVREGSFPKVFPVTGISESHEDIRGEESEKRERIRTKNNITKTIHANYRSGWSSQHTLIQVGEKQGNYDLTNRVYSDRGISRTIAADHDEAATGWYMMSRKDTDESKQKVREARKTGKEYKRKFSDIYWDKNGGDHANTVIATPKNPGSLLCRKTPDWYMMTLKSSGKKNEKFSDRTLGKNTHGLGNTLTATPKTKESMITDGIQVRYLTPLECERLQGFPDDYTKYGEDGKEISDNQRYKCVGNSVTVDVVQWIGERL